MCSRPPYFDPSSEERCENIRTREEYLTDPAACCPPYYPPCYSTQYCPKYVRLEDTYRRTRSYIPSFSNYPPPMPYCQPNSYYYNWQDYWPFRCPGGQELALRPMERPEPLIKLTGRSRRISAKPRAKKEDGSQKENGPDQKENVSDQKENKPME